MSDMSKMVAIWVSCLFIVSSIFYCSWICSRFDALHKDVVEIKLLLYKQDNFETLYSLGKLSKKEVDLMRIRLDTLMKMKKFEEASKEESYNDR